MKVSNGTCCAHAGPGDTLFFASPNWVLAFCKAARLIFQASGVKVLLYRPKLHLMWLVLWPQACSSFRGPRRLRGHSFEMRACMVNSLAVFSLLTLESSSYLLGGWEAFKVTFAQKGSVLVCSSGRPVSPADDHPAFSKLKKRMLMETCWVGAPGSFVVPLCYLLAKRPSGLVQPPKRQSTVKSCT